MAMAPLPLMSTLPRASTRMLVSCSHHNHLRIRIGFHDPTSRRWYPRICVLRQADTAAARLHSDAGVLRSESPWCHEEA